MSLKKVLFATTLALAMGAGVASAQEEWEFGVKGGFALNMMPHTTVTAFDQFKANIGFQGGVYGAVYLSDLLIGQVELLYSRKGVSTINHAGETAFGGAALKYARNIHYIQVPVLIGFHSFLDDRLKVMLGPELNVCVGNDIVANYDDPAFMNDDYELCPVNLGFGLQSTYYLTESLGIDLKFDFGVTRTFKKETDDKGHNTAVQLGLSYRFGY